MAWKAEGIQERFGHCDVPKLPEKNRQLMAWVSAQRNLRKRRKLDEARIQKLDALGFIWSLRDLRWYQMLENYREFKREHNDEQGMSRFKQHQGLGTWLNNQRIARAEGELEPTKIEALDELGFRWSCKAAELRAKVEAIKDYHRKHGDVLCHSSGPTITTCHLNC